ncbi:hypothetical protein [Bdellovibrio svalbardensis]|uniref:Uncharacterized protein n=1 Tax=Bdellovibrio svalbardensis TaxID=2972972 RepID=A0ABT6DM41_9BACT|nr:hypothetical protein [Bdellovibrio svalbardensis]MDG0817957.1 hypothetical protein [Bdellovibrio svalbardensis]
MKRLSCNLFFFLLHLLVSSVHASDGDIPIVNPSYIGNSILYNFSDPTLFSNPIQKSAQLQALSKYQPNSYLNIQTGLNISGIIVRCTAEQYYASEDFAGYPICKNTEGEQGAYSQIVRTNSESIKEFNFGLIIPTANSLDEAQLNVYNAYPPRSVDIRVVGKGRRPICFSSVGNVVSRVSDGLFGLTINYIAPLRTDSTSLNASVSCDTPLDVISIGPTSTSGYSDAYTNLNFLLMSYLNIRRMPAEASGYKIANQTLNRNGVAVGSPQIISIKDGGSISFALGAVSSLTLLKADGTIIPAKFVLNGNLNFITAIDTEKSLYPNHLGLLFNAGLVTENQQWVSLHMGSENLKIVAEDQSGTEFNLALNVVSPAQFGGNSNYDQSIIKYAHQFGIPPQMLKATIDHETGGTFDPLSFRYEPLKDLTLLGASIGAKNRVLFGDLLIKDLSPTVLRAPSSVYPRSIYGVFYKSKNLVQNLGNDFEIVEKRNALCSDLLFYNNDGGFGFSRQNWIPSAVANSAIKVVSQGGVLGQGNQTSGSGKANPYTDDYNFTAQTIVASSYGLMHVVHYYMVADFKFVNASGVAIDPTDRAAGLFNPDVNIKFGALKFGSAFTSINSPLQISSVGNFNEFSVLLRKASQKYNGINSKLAAARILPMSYNSNVWSKWDKYLPVATQAQQ